MPTPDPTVLAWTDMETTSLDAHEGHLLEVACIPTDLELKDLGGEFHRVVYYPVEVAKQLRATANEYVRAMHDKTGLWDRLPYGIPRHQVDQEMREFVGRYAPERRQAGLAGSSVKLDFDFTTRHLPATAEHLHYRVLDVTSVRIFLSGAGMHSPKVDMEPAHTALEDIRASIEEARMLRETVML